MGSPLAHAEAKHTVGDLFCSHEKKSRAPLDADLEGVDQPDCADDDAEFVLERPDEVEVGAAVGCEAASDEAEEMQAAAATRMAMDDAEDERSARRRALRQLLRLMIYASRLKRRCFRPVDESCGFISNTLHLCHTKLRMSKWDLVALLFGEMRQKFLSGRPWTNT